MDPNTLDFVRSCVGMVDANLTLSGQKRLDANETAFLARELEQVRSIEFTKDYPAARALAMLPIATDIDPLARTFVSKIYDMTGAAKVISEDAEDLPEVDVLVSEESFLFRTIGASYSYSVDDLARAARYGVPLDRKKAETARFVIDRAHDELLRTGTLANSAAQGLVGFVNASAVDKNPGTLHNWLDAATTGEEIVYDLTLVYNAIKTRTLDIWEPDTFVLASALWTAAKSKRMLYSDADPLTSFLRSFPALQTIDSWSSLNGAGDSSKHRVIAYKKSPQVIEAVVPDRFRQYPAQTKGFRISTPCKAKNGGVIIHRPGVMQYADFANAPTG